MKSFNPLLAIPAATVIVLAPFTLNFWDTPFSNSMQDWAHFGTYFAGILTPLVGLAIFWQMRENQKADETIRKQVIHESEQQSLIRTFELVNEKIETHISYWDIQHDRPRLSPFLLGAAPVEVEVNFLKCLNRVPKKGTYHYELFLISALLESLKGLTDKIDDKNYLYRFNLKYSGFYSELKKLGWLTED